MRSAPEVQDLSPSLEKNKESRPDSGGLFRPQVLEARPPKHGRVSPLTPPSWRWVTIGIATILLTVLVALALASFSRKEMVQGRLRPIGGEFRVVAPRPGIVRRVLVSDGAWVRQGQPLLTISTETVLNAGGSTNQRLIAGIAEERQALQSRLRNVTEAFTSQERENRLLQSSLLAQAKALGAEGAILNRRLDLAAKFLEAGRTLEVKGFITFSEMRRREEQKLAIEQDILKQDSARAQLISQAAQAGAAAAQAAAEAESQKNTIQQSLASLAQREVEAELQEGYVVRASLSGRVTTIRATAGKAVDAVQPLLTILAAPNMAAGGAAGNLVADLFVPTRAIGFVKPGQDARLLIDAFPYQKYGPIHGTIRFVSDTALAPQELESIEGDPKEPVYVATVVLDKASLGAFGASDSLKAGMKLSADIILEKRSLAEWLFEPLFASRYRM